MGPDQRPGFLDAHRPDHTALGPPEEQVVRRDNELDPSAVHRNRGDLYTMRLRLQSFRIGLKLGVYFYGLTSNAVERK